MALRNRQNEVVQLQWRPCETSGTCLANNVQSVLRQARSKRIKQNNYYPQSMKELWKALDPENVKGVKYVFNTYVCRI